MRNGVNLKKVGVFAFFDQILTTSGGIEQSALKRFIFIMLLKKRFSECYTVFAFRVARFEACRLG